MGRFKQSIHYNNSITNKFQNYDKNSNNYQQNP